MCEMRDSKPEGCARFPLRINLYISIKKLTSRCKARGLNTAPSFAVLVSLGLIGVNQKFLIFIRSITLQSGMLIKERKGLTRRLQKIDK